VIGDYGELGSEMKMKMKERNRDTGMTLVIWEE